MGREIVVEGNGFALAQAITAGPHRLTGDEPVEGGGTDSGPGPYDLLLAALGSCTSMTLTLYARHKGWPLSGLRVALRHARVQGSGPEGTTGLERIERHITVTGPLSGEQRQRLLEIAERCPVHRTLTGKIEIRSALD